MTIIPSYFQALGLCTCAIQNPFFLSFYFSILFDESSGIGIMNGIAYCIDCFNCKTSNTIYVPISNETKVLFVILIA